MWIADLDVGFDYDGMVGSYPHATDRRDQATGERHTYNTSS